MALRLIFWVARNEDTRDAHTEKLGLAEMCTLMKMYKQPRNSTSLSDIAG